MCIEYSPPHPYEHRCIVGREITPATWHSRSLAPRRPTKSSIMSALPPESASAIVGEIFSALVIQSTLGAELHDLEQQSSAALAAAAESQAAAAEAFLANVAPVGIDEGRFLEMQGAAQEALALATREKGLRQAAQSKLRVLLAERANEAEAQQRVDEQQKSLASKERELRAASSKAQHAVDRQAAATHSLKVERQRARSQRRAYGARCIVSMAHELWIVERLRRGLLLWRAKVVDAGIFDIAHRHAGGSPPPRGPAAAASLDADARQSRRDDELAHSAHRALLAARDAENLMLRQKVAALEHALALDEERQEALRRASERALQASALLLDARRQNGELTQEVADANAALARHGLPPAGAGAARTGAHGDGV